MTVILVMLTVLAVVGLELTLARRRRLVGATRPARLAPMLVPTPPQGLFLAPGHSWARITSQGTLRVGIDDFLSEAVGDVEAVEVVPRGSRVERGDPLIRLKAAGRVLEVAAPAAGEVVGVNERAVGNPWMVSRDPYGVGWLVSLWTRDHQEAIRPLRIGSGAVAFLREELDRFVDFLTRSAGPGPVPVMADGGLPVRGALLGAKPEQWQQFQEEFLQLPQA